MSQADNAGEISAPAVLPVRQKPLKREIELDFIRGIAIFMVLDFHNQPLVHLFPRLRLQDNAGWAGVSLFFVLSGFLVGGLLAKEWMVRRRVDGKQFLIRRGFKIWPQYYFYLALMLLTGHHTFRELWSNFANVQNYFGGIPHTWSLAVEEHAYILLTLGLVLAARMQLRVRHLLMILAMMCVSVSVLRMYQTLHGYGNAFYATHSRIDGIFYGVMLALVYHSAPEIFRRMQSWRWLWLAIVVVTLVFTQYSRAAAWLGMSAQLDLANAAGIALLMLLYKRREGQQRRSALYRLIAWVGVYSYGIYLWHVSTVAPTMVLAKHLPGWLAPVCMAFVPGVLGIAVGVLSSKLVEFPALRLRDRLFPRRVDSAVGIPAELEAKG